MTIILFLIILAILIFVHELGHFSIAKLFNIRVDEFAIGFPPKIFSWTKGETKYSLNAIPFGGYVKIFGENYDENSTLEKRSFVNASALKQIAVLFAGVFFNLLFAWFLVAISLNIGTQLPASNQFGYDVTDPKLTVLGIMKDSPAENAGIKAGDKILSIGVLDEIIQMPKVADFQDIVARSDSKEISINIEEGDSTREIKLSAEISAEGRPIVGVSLDYVGEFNVGLLKSIPLSLRIIFAETASVASGIWNFLSSAFSKDRSVFADVAGPVGIANMVGQASAFGLSYLLGFIALISINLAVLNLLPLPALDGGRIVFVILEKIFKNKIKPIVFNIINLIGFGLLILLMIFVTYKDIVRLIK